MDDRPNWAAPGPSPEPAPDRQPPGGWAAPGHGPPNHPPPGSGPPGYPPPGYPPPGYPPPGYGPPGSGLPQAPRDPGGYAPKPGVVPLRPLGVGEILDGAVSYIRRNPRATLGLSAIVAVITQGLAVVLQLVLLRGTAAATDLTDPATAIGLLVGGGVVGLATTALALLATAVLTGMLVTVLGEAVLGRTLTWGGAWARVRGRIPGLIGLSLLIGLVVGAIVLVALLPGIVAAVAGEVGAAVALTVVGALLGGAAAIWLGVSWSLATPAYALESIGLVAALRRSWQLVRGQWWRVFGISLLGALIALIVSGILTVPFTFGGSLLSDDPLDPLVLVIAGIGGVIASTLTTPFSAGIGGLLYVDQRIRREAFDLELGRAAGL